MYSSSLHVLVIALIYLLATGVTVAAGLMSWRRRAVAGATAFAVIMAAIAAWCCCDLVVLLATTGRLPPGAAPVAFAPIIPLVSAIVPGFWAISRAVIDRGWRPGHGALRLIVGYPLLISVAAISNPWSHVVYQRLPTPTDALWLAWTPGPIFWPHTVVCYLLLTWSCARLVQASRHGSVLQRRQALSLLLAVVWPAMASLVTDLSPPGRVPDLTAIAFAATGLIAGRALHRYGLLRLVPVARGLVFERLRDAVIVLDTDDRVLDVNAAAEALLRSLVPGLPGTLAGVPARDLLLTDARLPVLLAGGEYTVGPTGGRRVLDVRVEQLMDTRSHLIGRVIVVRDVTELARLRENLAEQAQHDELTGLYNRRYLVSALQSCVESCLRGEQELCIMMLDIDHFKSVNDQHGHLVGDALLGRVS